MRTQPKNLRYLLDAIIGQPIYPLELMRKGSEILHFDGIVVTGGHRRPLELRMFDITIVARADKHKSRDEYV
jgi:hypothetical protein